MEIFFNYPGIWAVVWYRIAHSLYKNNFKRLGRFFSGLANFLTNIDIHPSAKIGKRLFIDHGFGVVIGETSVIGNDVTIYQGVTLGGVTLTNEKRHPTIENSAVIGAGAKVLGNITIGENAKVGANSVVVKDVPKESTAVGIPARVVSKINEDKLSHNKLPDINKELFIYMIQRLKNLENAVSDVTCLSGDFVEEDKKLEEFYSSYIGTIEDKK
jgi:serine O-acetyltransferase